MKIKRGDRKDWSRIKKQKFYQTYMNEPIFNGYVTLLHFEEVNQPLIAKYAPSPITLVENGSYMVQHFPENENYCITTFISPSQEIVQWYIDIVDSIGLAGEVVHMKDLFLDLIVLPDYTIIEKDIDELEDAYQKKIITAEQYKVAWSTFNKLKLQISEGNFLLLDQTKDHFEKLKSKVN